MPLHWPTFFTRLGSAVVFAAIMMTGLLWNEWSFLGLVLLIQTLCLREYFRLMEKIDPDEAGYNFFPLTAGLGIVLLLLIGYQLFIPAPAPEQKWGDVLPSTWQEQKPAMRAAIWPMLLFAPVLLFLVAALSRKSSLRRGAEALAGLLYIVLPCALLLFMYQIDWTIPLALVLMIWTNDTMAYLVGSFIGKTPFSEISPKKTWEGTAGGALLTVIGAALIAWFFQPDALVLWILLSLCAAIAGTAGDLLESKLKRLANVKDSGTMMPGHGGALDRFDSLLVAVPFAFASAWLVQWLR